MVRLVRETQMCKIAWSTKGPSVEEMRCEWDKGERRGEGEREATS